VRLLFLLSIASWIMTTAGCTHETDLLGSPDHQIDITLDTMDTWVPDTMPPDIPDVPTECADSDGDGVCDSVDRCPGHDDHLDADGDGVPDGCDCDHAGIVCDPNATCVETGAEPACVCNPGYEGDGFTCTPIDHCARGTDLCDPNAICTYTGPGTYSCMCNSGYTGDGFTCAPIDHCALGTDLCDFHATCTYTGPGTYTCACDPGYTGDGFTCTPVSGGITGTVRRVDATWIPIQYVTCGSGSPGTCTANVAKLSCTSLGQKVVSHASDGTTEVYSLGATVSCVWSVSYFTVDLSMPPTSCLVGVSNLEWSGCCGTSGWHGHTVAFGAVSDIFGFVHDWDSGHVSTYVNAMGFRWGCVDEAVAAENLTGCTTQYIACTR